MPPQMTVHSLTTTCRPWGAAAAAAKACLTWLASTGKAPWRVTRWTMSADVLLSEPVAGFNGDISVTRVCVHQDSDQCKKSSSRRVGKGHHSKCKSRHGSNDAAHSHGGLSNCGMRSHVQPPPSYTGPKVCQTLWRISNMISDRLWLLTGLKIFSSCRIWQSFWNRLAAPSTSLYLWRKTLTCKYFSPWLKTISKK